jgi:hypothetical protein
MGAGSGENTGFASQGAADSEIMNNCPGCKGSLGYICD